MCQSWKMICVLLFSKLCAVAGGKDKWIYDTWEMRLKKPPAQPVPQAYQKYSTQKQITSHQKGGRELQMTAFLSLGPLKKDWKIKLWNFRKKWWHNNIYKCCREEGQFPEPVVLCSRSGGQRSNEIEKYNFWNNRWKYFAM